jgi:hypothetical protein
MLAPNALVDSFLFLGLPSKQQVLLFDSLIYPRQHLEDQIISRDDFPVFEELQERKIIRQLTLTRGDERPWLGFNPARDLWMQEPSLPDRHSAMAMARALRADLLKTQGIDAVPVKRGEWDWGPDDDSATSIGNQELSPVVELVLHTMPTPGNETPWKALLEFRDDPDTRHKLVGLRRWMTSFAKDARTQTEVRTELEFLMEEYRAHIRLHGLKWHVGTLESVMSLAAESLEGILRLKPTQLVSALFGVKHRRIALKEAEASAPGREVAYLVDAQAKFGGESSG